jgi:hypothetical protein
MDDRGDVSDQWDDEDTEHTPPQGEEDEKEARERIMDNFAQLQREEMQTIQSFSPPPARGGGGGQSSTVVVRGDGSERAPSISLDGYYRQVYNKDMNDRYGEWLDSSYTSSAEEEEDDVEELPDGEEEEGDSPSSSSGMVVVGEKRQRSSSLSGMEGGREKRPRQEYDIQQRQECFLCSWSNDYHDGIDGAHLNRLTAIIKENYGVHHNREIARELHLYFKNEVYRPGVGMGMLTTACALEHIEELHTQDARIFLGESIKQEKKLMFCFKNKIYREDGSWDKEALKEYRASKKELRTLYTMPLSRMNFNNGNTTEDMRRAANYHNLLQKFDKRPEKRKATTAFRI